MSCKYTNLTKVEIETLIMPFIPRNKRGFNSQFDMADIFKCIVHKLKTGCQWSMLFIDIECVKAPFSWQTVYYYYRKWCDHGVFENMWLVYKSILKDHLDTEKLNLDGTHSLVKKSADSANYQPRKRGRTSNVLVMTDGRGIPIAVGNILSGNHNDLFQIIPQFSKMINDLKLCGIVVNNSVLNADKGFDSKRFRRAIHRRKMFANIVENKRNRKTNKRGRKRFFNQDIYNQRFVNERTFAWIDAFRTLIIRYDKLDHTWINWHFLAFALIVLKV